MADQPARFKFGEGENEWTACNPYRWNNALQDQIAQMTEAKQFTARELLTEYLRLILPDHGLTTEEACGKLRAIRRAIKAHGSSSGLQRESKT